MSMVETNCQHEKLNANRQLFSP